MARPVGDVVGDLQEAVRAGAELVGRGRSAWDADRVHRLAGEAIISRVGEAVVQLPEEVRAAMPAVPWREWRAQRNLVAHVQHRIDPQLLWVTLDRDLPSLGRALGRWQQRSLQQESTRTPAPAALGL